MSLQDKMKFHDNKQDIVLIGEILIDEIFDSVNSTTISILGGSTANIAFNLNQLKCKTNLFCAVGNDEKGYSILDTLKSVDIDVSNINVINDSTTVVKIDKNSGSPVPTFERSSDNYIYYSEELEKSIISSKILHFSYWPFSKEPSKTTILKSIDLAKQNDILIGFDPNYHIDLDPSNGLEISEILNLIAKVDIVKPSLDDSIRLFGEGYSVTEYINKFLELGCKLVVMTLGADGLIANYKGDVVVMPSLAKEVIDSTGAGDSFWGGLYSGIITNESIYDSLRLGLLCSAYNLKQIGAYNDFPSLEQLKKELKIGE